MRRQQEFISGEQAITAISKGIIMPYPPSSGLGDIPVDNCRMGFFDYNDAATSTIPINVPGSFTYVDVTNDGLGLFTNKAYSPGGISDVYDATTNQFDWSELKLGDVVDIRIDLDVTTSSRNQLIEINLDLAIGGSQYSIPFISSTYKFIGVQKINVYNGVYIGDTNTLNNPGKLVIRSDDIATVKVNGWYVKVLIRG